MCAGGQRGACHPRAPPGAMRSGAGPPDQFLVSPGAQFTASLDTRAGDRKALTAHPGGPMVYHIP